MTAFPIAIGTAPRHSSSHPCANDALLATGSNRDNSLTATVHIHYRYLAVNPSDTSHHHNDQSDVLYNVLAELRVHIQHGSQSHMSSARETKCKVPLGTMKHCSTNNRQYYQPMPCVTLSNGHLACLVPFPQSYEVVNEDASSIVVVFDIVQTQSTVVGRNTQKRVLPPLPDYVQMGEESEGSDELFDGQYSTLPANLSFMAHNPRIVRMIQSLDQASSNSNQYTRQSQTPPIQSATCLCDLPTDSHRGNTENSSCSLLIGTNCGSVLMVDYASARVYCTLLDGVSHNRSSSDDQDTTTTSPIVHIAQCPPNTWKSLDVYGEETGSLSLGRIALVTRAGCAIVYSTSFVASSNLFRRSSSRGLEYARSYSFNSERAGRLELKLTRVAAFGLGNDLEPKLRYVRAKWLNPTFLVLLTRSSNLDDARIKCIENTIHISSDVVLAQVWRMNDVHSDTAAEYNGAAALVAELKLPLGDEDLMKEHAHGSFRHQPPLPYTNGDAVSSREIAAFVTNCESSMSISYHRDTDCLALCYAQSMPTVSPSR